MTTEMDGGSGSGGRNSRAAAAQTAAKTAAKKAAAKSRSKRDIAEAVDEAAGPVVDRNAIAAVLMKKAAKGNVSAANVLLRMGVLEEKKDDEAEEALLHLVELVLSHPEVCSRTDLDD